MFSNAGHVRDRNRRRARGEPRSDAGRLLADPGVHARQWAQARRGGSRTRRHDAGVEIKVSVADLRGDQKWPEYLEFCELFYFAIPPDFPDHHVPDGTGLIVADRYGGAIVRPSARTVLHASRRKAVTLSFAKVAAERLASVIELAAAT